MPIRPSLSSGPSRITAPFQATSVLPYCGATKLTSHTSWVTHWESEQSIRAFAGDDLLRAKYYPEDQDFLLEFEPKVQHFVVAAFASAA